MPVTATEEIENLRYRIAELEEQIGLALKPPTVFDLTATETAILGILLANPHPRKSTFMAAIYGADPDNAPSDKIIDLWICKVWRKLRPHGIEVKTRWGSGYGISEPSKARARELMEAA